MVETMTKQEAKVMIAQAGKSLVAFFAIMGDEQTYNTADVQAYVRDEVHGLIERNEAERLAKFQARLVAILKEQLPSRAGEIDAMFPACPKCGAVDVAQGTSENDVAGAEAEKDLMFCRLCEYYGPKTLTEKES